jgi:alpha-mannosidase
MSVALPDPITAFIIALRRLSQVDVQCQWRLCPALPTPQGDLASYPMAPLNDQGYITWAKGQQVQWLAQSFQVPSALAGYPVQGLVLRLALTWWAEDAQIFVQGQLVQQGDLFDSKTRIVLTPQAQPGERITVALRLVSPGHDIGALMQSQLLYEQDYPALDPGFVADELQVLGEYLACFAPDDLSYLAQVLAAFETAPEDGRDSFDQALAQLRQQLLPLAAAVGIKQRAFHLLGHAHLDMAWLWPLADTWEVGQRTFQSVLTLQQEFPDLVFGHTSPALYEWIEQNRPALFAQIQQAVKENRWELLGGMWIEPDANLPSGESLARQLLYGQRYFQSRFGRVSRVAWLPDSFGFCSQLPQLLAQAGIAYFVTAKLHWNDTTPFPHGVFNWRSPDGSQVLTVMGPPNVAGVMDTRPLVMTQYALDWEPQTGLQDMLWLPGVGDHGGGPTQDMWQVKQRWQASPFFPNLVSQRAEDYLHQIEQQLSQNPTAIPTWQNELYLQYHRGCYTNHADQKTYNRRAEHLLTEAELWSVCATRLRQAPYPHDSLEDAWKKVLLNQFHDILPGTSIPEVFAQANQDWQTVLQIGTHILHQALTEITQQIAWPRPIHPQAQPLLVFNALNWPQAGLISWPVSPQDWQVYDSEGQALPQQASYDQQLLFKAEQVPGLGYRSYWLVPQAYPSVYLSRTAAPILDNGRLRVCLDEQTGELASIFDYDLQRELLSGPGNQLQFFQDQGQYWDAWNIDPHYAQHPLPSAQLESLEVLEQGPLRWRIRVCHRFQQSRFQQDYCLEADSSLLQIQTQVDWQERQVLVKAAFPLALCSDTFTTEAPCGVVERPTQPQTAEEKAQWEVPHQHWVDLSDTAQNWGVSLLNESKYGCDLQGQQMRLTLLRGSLWPDPDADRGDHFFRYGLYSHRGNWRDGKTVQKGYAFNRPLRPWRPDSTASSGTLAPTQSLLSLGADHLCLLALKRAEASDTTWILRVYESVGKPANFVFENALNLQVAARVNLLEEATELSYQVNPWAIASFALQALD